MTRNYNITWYATKDGEDFTRNTFLRLSKPTGRTEYDAKAALNLFISQFGNLKKNTIIKIVEMDENGQIGKDIVPTGDNAIIPISKNITV